MQRTLRSLSICLLSLLSIACATQPHTDRRDYDAVASAHPLATQAGIDVLNQGGNAFDAAVAVSASLAVVEPYSSGIGGGGFWLLHRASDDRQVMIDGRERAPFAATHDMYQDENGDIVAGLSVDGPLSAGIPGAPAALVHIAEKYGDLPLRASLNASIEQAERGFEVDDIYRRLAGFRLAAMSRSLDSADIFLMDGQVPDLGYVIRQPDLADTLRRIAEHGKAGFYGGDVAQMLVDSVVEHGGIWTLEDLASYEIVERDPVRFDYRGMEVITVPPPSSGGVALSQIFSMLDELGYHDVTVDERAHVLTEAMRRAYRDRAEYLGDTDHVTVPMSRLLSRRHTEMLVQDFDAMKATPSTDLKAISVKVNEGNDTTHFSITDREGNRVSATLSINYPFGSGFVAEGTGVLLNDEMDDFSSKPGTPNVYGLVGHAANAIEPGKRMLSSMSPSFAEFDGRQAVIGTPGGSRIITMVMHGLLAFYEGEDAEGIVSRPRTHHQYLPDTLFYEPGAFSADVADRLRTMGHTMKELDSTYGNMHAIVVDQRDGSITAASDPRGNGVSDVIR